MNDPIEKISQTTVGVSALAASSGSMFLQWLTDWSSIVLIWVNIFFALGGICLVLFKIVKAWNEYKKNKNDR